MPLVECLEFTAAGDQPRGSTGLANLETTVGREAFTTPCDAERARRGGGDQGNGIRELFADPHPGEQHRHDSPSIGLRDVGNYGLAEADQSVEATNDSRQTVSGEGNVLPNRLSRQEADAATGRQHHAGFVGQRPDGLPADQIVERFNDKGLAQRAERKIDERCPGHVGVDKIGQRSDQPRHGRGRDRFQRAVSVPRRRIPPAGGPFPRAWCGVRGRPRAWTASRRVIARRYRPRRTVHAG